MVASAFTVAAVQLLVPGAAATCCPMQHQPPHHGADFDQLKQDLVLAVDNHDITGALELVSKLENSTMTKEILEHTRLGGTVNEIRRKLAEYEPDLAKRCRALIKRWQKLIDFSKPSSLGGSSNNTTPSLVSPAIRSRGVTPRTPADKLGLQIGGLKTDTNISPGYAPKKISPLMADVIAKNIHKSQSVGADLSRRAVEKSISPETKANGDGNGTLEPLKLTIKRAAVTTDVNAASLKRSKTSATNLDHVQDLRESKTSSPSPVQSVTAARKNVQSTTELVAQLSENLPQHMTIDLSEHQMRRGKIELQPKIVPPMTILRSSLPDVIPQARTKRKYTKKHERFFKNGQIPQDAASFESTSTIPEENENEFDDSGVVEMDPEPEGPSVSEPAKEEIPKTTDEVSEKVEKKKENEGRKPAFDWFKKLSLDNLLGDRLTEHAEPSEDQRKSYVMQVRQREVLCLPIVDIGMPDFLEYNYPNPDQFIADRSKGPPVPQRMP